MGSDGISPAHQSDTSLVKMFGSNPRILDWLLDVICMVGMFLSCVGALGMASLATLLATWLLYFSLCSAGGSFGFMEWDVLLLEVRTHLYSALVENCFFGLRIFQDSTRVAVCYACTDLVSCA